MKSKNECLLKNAIEETMNLTSIQLSKKVKLWRRYISKQTIIRVIDDESEIKMFHQSCNTTNFSFAVLFPKSFLHLNDFRNGIKNATAIAIFSTEGDVTIFIDKNEPISLGYLNAWNMIMLRTTSRSFDFISSLKIPRENLDVTDIEEVQNTITKQIQAWIDQFNKIPGVNAQRYTGHETDKIIDINLPGSLDAFINGSDEPTFCIALMTNQKFHDYYTAGEVDSICSKWREELKTSNVLDWEGVYNWVIKLIKSYTTAIPTTVI